MGVESHSERRLPTSRECEVLPVSHRNLPTTCQARLVVRTERRCVPVDQNQIATSRPSTLRGIRERACDATSDSTRTPCGCGSVKNIVKRYRRGCAQRVECDAVSSEDLDSFERTTCGLLAIGEWTAVVHRAEGHFGVDFVDTRVRLRQLCYMQDAAPE